MSKSNLPKAAVPGRPGVKSDVTATAAQRWNPDIRAAADDEGATSISVLDPIGADFWGDGVTAKRIAAVLRSVGSGDVVVNINSPGGDYFEGLAIYNLLREHKGRVTVRILGIAASAASIIAMAGDEVQIGRAAFLMIHNTWVVAAGDRHAFRDVADWLEPFDQAAASIYAARTGMAEAEIAAMLDRETWIGGEAAVSQGFADSLLDSDAVETAQNAAEFTPMAAAKKLDLFLASGARASKSERRQLVAALKGGGKSGAAPDSGKSGAAVTQLAQDALAKLNSI
ncbi:Clp protease ClpP [Leisingera daeponensis]|uniref:ATP-dependent Clp protease proteolytic subunit n=1 Tax=Leisingera daeponensis TaxID=405746 RepID=A0ABS7NCQ7_9RHOB|nr:head maturation protease, ClpP-related [Leisingera daeponensis]MBY6138534.1 Clp protease ClpP [Leisingera daeponensis]